MIKLKAKELNIEKWLNCKSDFNLDVLSNKIKIIHVFQMLCPGCVYKGIPQTMELFNRYDSDKVVVAAIHSVFENHNVMTPEALEVFIKEWRIPFPVGIDKRIGDNWMPETMKSYNLQGTPSLIIIDHEGSIKLCHFGHIDNNKLNEFILNLIEKKQAA